MKRKKIITFGVPCFNEELNVAKTYEALKKIASKNKQYDCEYIFVDNGSSDRTKDEIKKLSKKDKNIIGICLSRNFGPEASSQATIDAAKGDAMILYDCDRQDPPELILEFIKKWEEGYNLVVGIRKKSEDNFLMSIARKSFYRILRIVSNIDIPVDAGNFSLMDRKVISTLQKLLPEKYRFYRGLRAWVGFKTAFIPYKRRNRKYGSSTQNLFSYFSYAIRSLFGFSYLPLNITVYIGFILIIVSFIFIITYFIQYIFSGKQITNSELLILLVVSFSGAQLLAISMIGKYIQVIIEETKNRPLYLIDEIITQRK